VRISFITATPLNHAQGSGTFTGLITLARALRRAGVEIEIVVPGLRLPVFTAQRLLFNEQLRARRWDRSDLTVGIDMDGYRIAGRTGKPHVASIKGVIADEMRFERGATRATMSIQARCEALHVRRAGMVITTSRYAAGKLQELYGLAEAPVIVPELIDLSAWEGLFARNPAAPAPGTFAILTVCRFYPRKRLHLLLGAAARLRGEIRGLEVRIVGGGPEAKRLHSICREKRLGDAVQWPGNLSQDELAREYNRCDVFCLPSVQEGFGIVFLEAMAAGKPIVAARAGAVPEAVEHGLLAEPESEESLAEALLRLYRDPELRTALAEAGKRTVMQFNAPDVARTFLESVRPLL
jgi:glycosyltransferase involved in cell wall biosynthesis